jgi:hypothetical protein
MMPCESSFLVTFFITFLQLLCFSAAANDCTAELDKFRSSLREMSSNYWGLDFRGNLQKFDEYANILSDHMKSCDAKFQFISVGSCDGTSDSMIRAFYENNNWNGLFVEASPPNIEYLKQMIHEKSGEDRSVVLHAAAMEYCVEPTLEFVRPRDKPEDSGVDKKNHWRRRQIGRVPKSADTMKYYKSKSWRWTFDVVPCMTGRRIYDSWERESPFSTKTPGNRFDY